MKLFVAYFNLHCCSNNSDGKLLIMADNKEKAEEKAKKAETIEQAKRKNITFLKVVELDVKEAAIISSTFDDSLLGSFYQYHTNFGNVHSK